MEKTQFSELWRNIMMTEIMKAMTDGLSDPQQMSEDGLDHIELTGRAEKIRTFLAKWLGKAKALELYNQTVETIYQALAKQDAIESEVAK